MSLTYFQFECQLCHDFIRENDPDIEIENKEIEENMLFGKITTVHVGHKKNKEFHWNIITLDQNGEYRGHKHSFSQKIEEEEQINFSLLKKYIGKKMGMLISDIISGKSICIISEDSVLQSIIITTLNQFKIPKKDEELFQNQISTNEALNRFEIDKKKYHQKASKTKYRWVSKLLDKLDGIDETATRHIILNYMESIRNAYYQIMDKLSPYFLITDICPINDPGSTVQLQLFMDNIIPAKELRSFTAICSINEYEIIMDLISRQFSMHYNLK